MTHQAFVSGGSIWSASTGMSSSMKCLSSCSRRHHTSAEYTPGQIHAMETSATMLGSMDIVGATSECLRQQQLLHNGRFAFFLSTSQPYPICHTHRRSLRISLYEGLSPSWTSNISRSSITSPRARTATPSSDCISFHLVGVKRCTSLFSLGD